MMQCIQRRYWTLKLHLNSSRRRRMRNIGRILHETRAEFINCRQAYCQFGVLTLSWNQLRHYIRHPITIARQISWHRGGARKYIMEASGFTVWQ